MADFRQIHTKIWKDGWFLDLEPDEKLLFVYLFSNERASVAGIYELPVKVICFETGLEKARVLEIFGAFKSAGKAYYESNIVWVPNMRKYQDSGSPKLLKRIEMDVAAIPECKLKQEYISRYRTDTLSIPYPENVSDTDTDTDTDTERDTDTEGDTETESSTPAFDKMTISEILKLPEIKIYHQVTGRTPGMPAVPVIYGAIRRIQAGRGLYPNALIEYLRPYWTEWAGNRGYRQDNNAWLTDWAVNNTIPPAAKGGRSVHVAKTGCSGWETSVAPPEDETEPPPEPDLNAEIFPEWPLLVDSLKRNAANRSEANNIERCLSGARVTDNTGIGITIRMPDEQAVLVARDRLGKTIENTLVGIVGRQMLVNWVSA